MIQLCSHGVTTHEISDLIKKIYGRYYLASTAFNIYKQFASQVESYHQRQLSDKFSYPHLGAAHIFLRRNTYQREAVYVAVRIKPNDHQRDYDCRIALDGNIEILGV